MPPRVKKAGQGKWWNVKKDISLMWLIGAVVVIIGWFISIGMQIKQKEMVDAQQTADITRLDTGFKDITGQVNIIARQNATLLERSENTAKALERIELKLSGGHAR